MSQGLQAERGSLEAREPQGRLEPVEERVRLGRKGAKGPKVHLEPLGPQEEAAPQVLLVTRVRLASRVRLVRLERQEALVRVGQ